MSNNLIKEIVYFNSLEKSGKLNFICSKLDALGYKFNLQQFDSSFGRGCNIIAFSVSEVSAPYTVLSAHYDGDSLFDNDGGVFGLINIAELILKNKKGTNFVILFTDQEEEYQQGSYYFLKSYSDLKIKLNINIDGFGIGENIYTLDFLPIENSEMFFLTDSKNFDKAKIKSTTIFSSFDNDVKKTKKNDVYYVFKEYINSDFFIRQFEITKYNKIIGDLWNHISHS